MRIQEFTAEQLAMIPELLLRTVLLQSAVRAFRRAVHANREWFRAAFADCDSMFDAGEFGGGRATDDMIDRRLWRLAHAIGERYGFTADEIDQATELSLIMEEDFRMLSSQQRRRH